MNGLPQAGSAKTEGVVSAILIAMKAVVAVSDHLNHSPFATGWSGLRGAAIKP
jgi:hypothetical protein